MMKADALVNLFSDKQLRQYVAETAIKMTTDRKAQKDLVGYCWSELSKAPSRETHEYYRLLCDNAMKRRYFQKGKR